MVNYSKSRSSSPISFDDLESTRTTFIEMKNGTKKVEKDDWRAVSGPEKRLDKQWRGRTVFKIKAGVALPAEELSHVKSSSKTTRTSDPSDEVQPDVKDVCCKRCPWIAISVYQNTIALGFRDIRRLVLGLHVSQLERDPCHPQLLLFFAANLALRFCNVLGTSTLLPLSFSLRGSPATLRFAALLPGSGENSGSGIFVGFSFLERSNKDFRFLRKGWPAGVKGLPKLDLDFAG